MYEIRKISLNHMNGKIVVEKGVEFARLVNVIALTESFWGLSTVNELVPIKDNRITYANSYKVEPYKFPRIKLTLNVGLQEEIEGLIVFINLPNEKVETDGEVIYQKRHQAVFVLREGQFIKIGSKKVKILAFKGESSKF